MCIFIRQNRTQLKMEAQFINCTMQITRKRENQDAQSADHEKRKRKSNRRMSSNFEDAPYQRRWSQQNMAKVYVPWLRRRSATVAKQVCSSGEEEQRRVNLMKKSEEKNVEENEDNVYVLYFYRDGLKNAKNLNLAFFLCKIFLLRIIIFIIII